MSIIHFNLVTFSIYFRFYGIIVSNVNLYNPPRNLDLEQQYPNPQRYSGSSDQYYLTAGFADATDSNVPTTFVVGDGGTTTASDVMYFNAGLERRTTYRVLLIVEISSGVPGVRERERERD